MRVYVDIVAAINFLVDFLLILGTNRLAGFPPGWGRAAKAATLGGAYGGVCMLAPLRFLGGTLWRLIVLAGIALIAFGWNRGAVQRGAVFILLSMALGGIAAALGRGSFPTLMLAAGGMLLLCRTAFRGSVGQKEYVPVELTWRGRTLSLIALRDTGNSLRDPITGEQVLVAGADVATELVGLTAAQLSRPVELLASGAYPGLRLIPYHAVGVAGGMLPALRFADAKIGDRTESPLVAFAPEALSSGGVYRMLTGGAV